LQQPRRTLLISNIHAADEFREPKPFVPVGTAVEKFSCFKATDICLIPAQLPKHAAGHTEGIRTTKGTQLIVNLQFGSNFAIWQWTLS
jgi:hypothetical protein